MEIANNVLERRRRLQTPRHPDGCVDRADAEGNGQQGGETLFDRHVGGAYNPAHAMAPGV
jgi:hypothetical protein